MIAVIAVCVLGPFSAVYVLGWAAAALLPGVGLVLGLTLGLGIQPGTFSLADEIVGACRRAVVGEGRAQPPRLPPPHSTAHLSTRCSRPDGRRGAGLLRAAAVDDLLAQAGGLLCCHSLAEVGKGGRGLGLGQGPLALPGDPSTRQRTGRLNARVPAMQSSAPAGTMAGCRRCQAGADTPHAAPSRVRCTRVPRTAAVQAGAQPLPLPAA